MIDWANIMPSYDDMLAAGMHYGRKKTVFHPKMERFVYTLKESIHILDLLKTEEKLKEAAEFLRSAKDTGKLILWVASTKQSEDKIVDIAKILGMPYVTNRWLGGTLTNFKTMRSRIDYFESVEQKLNQEKENPQMLKKERVRLEKEYQDMRQKFDGLRLLVRVPDVLFITSLKGGLLPAREAKRTGIKTVAILNTESDPTLVDFPIPANDNARSSVQLLMDTIKKAIV